MRATSLWFLELRFPADAFYTAAADSHFEGAPIMRGLALDFPDALARLPTNTCSASPSWWPPACGATSRGSTCPARRLGTTPDRRGAEGWHVAAGGAARSDPTVKAGAIVPMGPVMQYVDERPDAPLTINVYRRGWALQPYGTTGSRTAGHCRPVQPHSHGLRQSAAPSPSGPVRALPGHGARAAEGPLPEGGGQDRGLLAPALSVTYAGEQLVVSARMVRLSGSPTRSVMIPSMPPAVSRSATSASFTVYHARQPAAQAPHQVGVHHPPVHHGHHAGARSLEPAVPQCVQQQGAGAGRARPRAPSRASGLNELEQGRQWPRRPAGAAAFGRHHLAGAALHAGTGLDLDVQRAVVGPAEGRDLLKVGRRSPAGLCQPPASSGVRADQSASAGEPWPLVVRPRCRRAGSWSRHGSASHSKGAVAVLQPEAEGGQGVFRCQLAGAAVGNPQG